MVFCEQTTVGFTDLRGEKKKTPQAARGSSFFGFALSKCAISKTLAVVEMQLVLQPWGEGGSMDLGTQTTCLRADVLKAASTSSVPIIGENVTPFPEIIVLVQKSQILASLPPPSSHLSLPLSPKQLCRWKPRGDPSAAVPGSKKVRIVSVV